MVGGDIGGMKRKKRKDEGKWERVLFGKGGGRMIFWWGQAFFTLAYTKFVSPN